MKNINKHLSVICLLLGFVFLCSFEATAQEKSKATKTKVVKQPQKSNLKLKKSPSASNGKLKTSTRKLNAKSQQNNSGANGKNANSKKNLNKVPGGKQNAGASKVQSKVKLKDDRPTLSAKSMNGNSKRLQSLRNSMKSSKSKHQVMQKRLDAVKAKIERDKASGKITEAQYDGKMKKIQEAMKLSSSIKSKLDK